MTQDTMRACLVGGFNVFFKQACLEKLSNLTDIFEMC